MSAMYVIEIEVRFMSWSHLALSGEQKRKLNGQSRCSSCNPKRTHWLEKATRQSMAYASNPDPQSVGRLHRSKRSASLAK